MLIVSEEAVAEGMTPVVVLAGGFFWTRSSTGLGAADIFKTLSVIAIVSGPLSRVLVCMPFLVGSMACLGRIQKYLLLEELVDTRIIDHDNDATLDTVIKEKPVGGVWAKSKCAMELEAATLSVPSIDRPLIKNAHMKDRRRGNVTMIYGPVGCGKSTLLKAIIGEVGLQSGRVRLGSGQVAYCDQTPWLQNWSIRDNIIAQTEYIADRYNDVLYCCALDEDMKQFSDGDKTIIGSRGSTLSGGQKQRVVRLS
jgi:ABC-type multidrug transport system fused ATPase/permease subunit